MRKILILLLIIMLLATNPMLALALEQISGTELNNTIEQPIHDTANNEDTQITAASSMAITNIDASQEITYYWDVDASLFKEQQDNNSEATVLLKMEANRHIKSNMLNMVVGAEIHQLTNINSIAVDLGYAAEDGFELIKSITPSKIEQSPESNTHVNLNLNMELKDLDKSRLALRLTTLECNAVTPSAIQEILLPENSITKAANNDVWLSAISDMGIVNDKWKISEDMLDRSGSYEKEVEIVIDEIDDNMDLNVIVSLIGDDDEILCSKKVFLTLENNAFWNGNVYPVHGFWLMADMDGFCLERKAVPVSFWLQDKINGLSMNIYEANVDNSGNLTLGEEPVYILTEDEFRTGIQGRRSKSGRNDMVGEYYTVNLKGKNMPFLNSSNTYALVIKADDNVLTFDEETPAILTFEVSNETLIQRNIKINLQRCGNEKNPKYDGSSGWK